MAGESSSCYCFHIQIVPRLYKCILSVEKNIIEEYSSIRDTWRGSNSKLYNSLSYVTSLLDSH